MKRFFKSAFDCLLFSNIFMALCAVAQGLLTFRLIGSKPIYTVLGLLFAATLATYNISILITKPKQPQRSPYIRVRWFFSHYRLMISFTIVSILALIPLFLFISFESKILLVFMGVLSIGYSLPLFAAGDQKFGLRHIPGLKPFLIATVWTLSSVLLPVLEATDAHMTNISMHSTVILLAKRFLFIGALTIPFDIRDLFEDRQNNLKTIPVAWGEKNAYLFCQLLMLGYVVLLLVYQNGSFNASFIALALTAVLTGWLIFKSKWEKNEYYYFFYLDGVLILQYVILVIVDWLMKII